MTDQIHIRIEGRAGRITLTRTKALNALSYDMCLAVDAALKAWATDDEVALVVIDAEGDKAFCAGGDIRAMYDHGIAGDYDYGRRFWHDEYRMNARLAEYGKPIVAFLQGYVMGGGVGLGGHVRHRIVGDSTKIAMPETAIGLVPDVGGSILLARAPGRMGDYLAVTGDRMGPGDAITAGFADHYLPEGDWPALKARLVETGDAAEITRVEATPPAPLLDRGRIDRLFASGTLVGSIRALEGDDSEVAQNALKSIRRNSPLAMATALRMLDILRMASGIRDSLRVEYRFTWRAMEQSDFLEGVRALIIDKDRQPQWKHTVEELRDEDVNAMLAPLGPNELTFEEE